MRRPTIKRRIARFRRKLATSIQRFLIVLVKEPRTLIFDINSPKSSLVPRRSFSITGWILPARNSTIRNIRARSDKSTFNGTYGYPRPDVVREYGQKKAHLKCGFWIEVVLPKEGGEVTVEYQTKYGKWKELICRNYIVPESDDIPVIADSAGCDKSGARIPAIFPECSDTAVVLHLFYCDLWIEIASYLQALGKFDLFVSIPEFSDNKMEHKIRKVFPSAVIQRLHNKGRDILPFLYFLNSGLLNHYRYVCKLHSKKSIHISDGDIWRKRIYDALVGSPNIINQIKRAFNANSEIGLIGPDTELVTKDKYAVNNEKAIRNILNQHGWESSGKSAKYIQGSMFWFKPPALSCLQNLRITDDDFEEEAKQLDGTLAHAIERLFPRYVQESGYETHTLGTAKLLGHSNWEQHPYKIAFAVSDDNSRTRSGDLFTAYELGLSLTMKFGWEISFLAPKNWYETADFDFVVAMVEGYSPSCSKKSGKRPVTIAWIRNWFEKWASSDDFSHFDMVLSSSMKGANIIKNISGREASILRIATNAHRFTPGLHKNKKKKLDYVFTGSQWSKDLRDIATVLPIAAGGFSGAVYGEGWDDVEGMKDLSKGSVDYEAMPELYRQARLCIDDANSQTRAAGSINSRVFDAIAAGCLPVTNGAIGVGEIFDDRIPIYNTPHELKETIQEYCSSDVKLKQILSPLREEVLSMHTYDQRADELIEHLSPWLISEHRIAIVSTGGENSPQRELGKELRKLGHDVNVIHTLACCDPDENAYDLLISDEISMADVFQCVAKTFVGLWSSNKSGDAMRYKSRFDNACDIAELEGRDIALSVLRSYFIQLRHQMRLRESYGVPHIATLDQSIHDLRDGVTPLRIAYVLWDYPVLSQTFVLLEIRWLIQNDYDVRVYYKEEPDIRAKIDFDVQSYRISNSNELAKLLVVHRRTHCHSHFAYPAAAELTFPACTATGIPFSVMPHAVDIFHESNITRNRLAEMGQHPLCSRFVVHGDFHRNYIIKHGVPREKISTAMQAVDITAELKEIQIEERLARQPKVVMTLARFVEKKGIKHLIAAMAQLPDLELHIYGYGPLLQNYRDQIELHELSNVKLRGRLDGKSSVLEAFNEADIFALPCVRSPQGDMDGIPTVLMEAMASGLPVITTRLSGIPGFIKHEINGFLVEPKQEGELADMIRTVSTWDRSRLTGLLENAKSTVASLGAHQIMRTLLDGVASMPIDIFLVTYNTSDHEDTDTTLEIIRRIYEHTTTPFNLTIVDNQSDLRFVKAIQEIANRHPNCRFVALGSNKFCGGSSNIALNIGQGEFSIYICSKEGFVLKAGWERHLINAMRGCPEAPIGGHLIFSPSFVDGRAYLELPWFDYARNPGFAQNNQSRPFFHVQGGFYILRRSFYLKHGGFNPRIRHNGMDIEYSYYTESLGLPLLDVPNLTSLSNKTLPPLTAHLDENTVAAHPLTLAQLPEVAALVSGKIKSRCNVCGFSGRAFASDTLDCPDCGSLPFSRLIYRHLASSNLVYRNLAAILLLPDLSLKKIAERIFGNLEFRIDNQNRFRLSQLEGHLKHKKVHFLAADLNGMTSKDTQRAIEIIQSSIIPGGQFAVSTANCINRVNYPSSSLGFGLMGLQVYSVIRN